MSWNAMKIKLYALRLSKSEKTIHQSCAALAASAIVCSFSGIHQLQQFHQSCAASAASAIHQLQQISNSTKSAIQQIHQISKSAIKAIPPN